MRWPTRWSTSGKHENKEKINLPGSFAHNVSGLPGPNNRTYYETKVNRLAVGVVDSLPFKVKLHQPATPLSRAARKT